MINYKIRRNIMMILSNQGASCDGITPAATPTC